MKDINNNFLHSVANYAIVIRGDIETINKIKQNIAQNQGIEIVYQKFSFDKLIIHVDGDTSELTE